jgi:hypothetical protein
MLKKYMIFGSVVLLLAALLTVTGCSQATDSDGTTLVIGENHLFGYADQDAVARAVASAKATGRSVVISDGTWLVSNGALRGVADFEKLPVRVEGSVTVSAGVIVNAAFASLTFAEGASITVHREGAFIYQGDGDDKKIGTDPTNPGYKVKFVTDPKLGTQGTDQHVAILDYKIGADFANIAPHITHLYVLDKITVDAGSIAEPGVAGNPRVIALGTVALEASNSLVFAHTKFKYFQFTGSSVLTSTAPSLTLTLGDEEDYVVLPTIDATVPLTIQGRLAGIEGLTIAGIKGPAPLTIKDDTHIGALTITEIVEGALVSVSTPALGDVTITKNAGSISLGAPDLAGSITIGNNVTTGTITIAAGNIDQNVTVKTENSGTINFDAPTITSPAVVTIARNTGEVNFVQNLSVTTSKGIKVPVNTDTGVINFYGTFTSGVLGDGDLTPAAFANNIAGSGKLVFGGLATFGGNTNIDSNLVFNAGFTQAANTTLALGGDVTLANGQSITIGFGTGSITLKEAKKLLVGDVPVLVGGAGGAKIKPPNSTPALTLLAGIRVPDDEDDLNYKTLALTGGSITGIDGDLRIAGTGLLFTETTIETGLGSLTLEDGAILLLPSTDSKVTLGTTTGTDTVIAGTGGTGGDYPTIAYATPVQFAASGGAVSLGSNKISGSGATLVSPEDITGGPQITLGDLASGSANKILTIAGVNLDLQFGGSLAIAKATAGTPAPVNKVILEAGANPGKITLGDDTGTTFGSSLAGTYIDTDTTAGYSVDDAPLGGVGVLLGDSETLPCTIGAISGAPNGQLTITGLPSTGTDPVTIGVGTGLGSVVVGP